MAARQNRRTSGRKGTSASQRVCREGTRCGPRQPMGVQSLEGVLQEGVEGQMRPAHGPGEVEGCQMVADVETSVCAGRRLARNRAFRARSSSTEAPTKFLSTQALSCTCVASLPLRASPLLLCYGFIDYRAAFFVSGGWVLVWCIN
jgi:hypothetical protein